MTIFWFIVFIILLLIEIATVDLVSIWFAFGSVVALLLSIFVDSLVIQVATFLIVSLISLLVTKPLIKKFKVMEMVPTNSDRVIGKVATVTKEIKNDKYGEVKVLGSIWTACSDSNISVGNKVKVISIDGVKLIVERMKED